MKEGVFIVYVQFAALWSAEIDMRSFQWVTHLDDPSGIMCSVCTVMNVSARTLQAQKQSLIRYEALRGRRTERWPSIKPVKKWFPEITFSLSLTFCHLIWTSSVYFSARETSAHRITRTGARGAWRISPWLMMRIPVVCHQLLFSLKNCYGCRWLHIELLSSHPPALATCARRWGFLSFIKPLFPLPGLWRDWKGERGQRREVLIHYSQANEFISRHGFMAACQRANPRRSESTAGAHVFSLITANFLSAHNATVTLCLTASDSLVTSNLTIDA